QGFVGRFVARPGVAGLMPVVVPVDVRILVNQALAYELLRSGDSEIAITPRAVGENYGGKVPGLAEVLEIEVPPESGAGYVEDAGLLQAVVDPPVFHFALLHVPAREAILNFSVRAGVLFDDGDMGAALGEDFRGNGSGDAPSDDGNEMFCSFRHGH